MTCSPGSVNPTPSITCVSSGSQCFASPNDCDQAGRTTRSPGTIYIDPSSPTLYDFNLFTALDPLCNVPITCYLCNGANYNTLSDATVAT